MSEGQKQRALSQKREGLIPMQKKVRILSLVFVLAMCMSLCANAAARTKNDFTYSSNMSVSGNTANCSLRVDAKNAGPNATITVDIDVQVRTSSGGWSSITGWGWSGTSTLDRSKSHTDSRVSRGNTRMAYTITVVGSNGTDIVSGYVEG